MYLYHDFIVQNSSFPNDNIGNECGNWGVFRQLIKYSRLKCITDLKIIKQSVFPITH